MTEDRMKQVVNEMVELIRAHTNAQIDAGHICSDPIEQIRQSVDHIESTLNSLVGTDEYIQ